MGWLDSKGSLVICPACGARRAKKLLWKIRCVNSGCRYFDSEYAAEADLNRIRNKDAVQVFPNLKGTFSPGSGAIRVRYENFRGDQLNYLADAQGAYRAGEFLVMRVAPTGKHIAFRLAYIQNRSEVEGSLPSDIQENLPTANERRILNFHLKRGSQSPRFLQVRQKFPNYQP